MARLSEFSIILGLFIDISSIINKIQFNEENKIINLLGTGEGIAFIIVLNLWLIYISREWFLKQWEKFRKTPRILGIRNRFYQVEPLFSMGFLEEVARKREKEEEARRVYDELYEKAFGKNK